MDYYVSKSIKIVPGRHITTQSGTKTAFHDQLIIPSSLSATKINSKTFEAIMASISSDRSFLKPHTHAATVKGHKKNRGINVNNHLWLYVEAISI